MLHDYHVIVRFDEETENIPDKRVYFGVVDKYSASYVMGEITGTSALFFNSDKELSQKRLQKDFKNIEILSFEEISLGE